MLKQTKFIVDGVPWVRGSYEELLAVFPWLSISSLKRIILGLQQRKMLIAEQRGSGKGIVASGTGSTWRRWSRYSSEDSVLSLGSN